MGNISDLQLAQLVLIAFAVVNIILLDFFCVYQLSRPVTDVEYVDNFRHWHSLFSILIIIPVAGCEVQLYLDSLLTTDLICVFVLALDLGFRGKGAMEHLKNYAHGLTLRKRLGLPEEPTVKAESASAPDPVKKESASAPDP